MGCLQIVFAGHKDAIRETKNAMRMLYFYQVASSKPERLVPFARIVEIIRWTFSSWVRTNLFLFLNLQLPGSILTNNDDKKTGHELYPKTPSKFPAQPSGLGYIFFFS